MVFHSPYNKLVQQSFRRLIWNDAVAYGKAGIPLPAPLAGLAPFVAAACAPGGTPAETPAAARELDKALQGVKGDAHSYARMVGPSEHFSTAIGNSYTGAVYANLTALVDSSSAALEKGARVGVFSYGSGAIASLFSLEGSKGTGQWTLPRIAETVNLKARLAARRVASPAEFTEALAMREASYGRSGREPVGDIANVPVGGWYVKGVAPNGVRSYARK